MKSAFASAVLVLGLLVMPVQVQAQGACDTASTTIAMRQCAASQLKDAKEDLAELLAEYAREVGSDRSQLLNTSQEKWEEYKDASCRFVAARYAGGTLEPVTFLRCSRDLTRARIVQLRTQLEGEGEFNGKADGSLESGANGT